MHVITSQMVFLFSWKGNYSNVPKQTYLQKLYISKDVFEEMDKKFGSPQIGDIPSDRSWNH